MRFSGINISNWKQFDEINIDFHPRVTVLTGANGSGKTTILNILAKHFGWNNNELSTPAKDERGIISFVARYFKNKIYHENRIGSIEYDNGSEAYLQLPKNVNSAQYNLNIQSQQRVDGFNIPSHRPVFSYKSISSFSTQQRGKKQAFNLIDNELKRSAQGNRGGKSVNYHIKETLLSWAINGYGNQAVESNQELINNYEGFQYVLRQVLPDKIGFQKFSIRKSEIVFITDSGEFLLDAASGGISALINLAWQLYMFSTDDQKPFVVTIDEIENHLHAEMQRSVLPDFIEAFPNVQFIVSTHSPLVVGSVKNSNVYALRFNEEDRVYARELDLVNKAKTATEILREVLGVPFSMPIWVEDKLNSITKKYSDQDLNEESLNSLRRELEEVGLSYLVPESIAKVMEANEKN